MSLGLSALQFTGATGVRKTSSASGIMTSPTWGPHLLMALLLVGCVDEVRTDIGWSGEVKVSQKLDDVTSCNGNENETWIVPYPQCTTAGLCTCAVDTCKTIVQYNTLATDDAQFYCGECGSFGACCSTDNDCLAPYSSCSDNGYCVCSKGYSSYGVCMVIVTHSGASPINLALTGILLLIIFCNKCISSRSIQRRWRRFTRRCLRRNSEDQTICQIDVDGTYHNPRGNDKSPSYSLGNQEFNVSSDDPDMDWAVALSLMELTRRQSASSSVCTSSASTSQQPAVTRVEADSTLCEDVCENIIDDTAEVLV